MLGTLFEKRKKHLLPNALISKKSSLQDLTETLIDSNHIPHFSFHSLSAEGPSTKVIQLFILISAEAAKRKASFPIPNFFDPSSQIHRHILPFFDERMLQHTCWSGTIFRVLYKTAINKVSTTLLCEWEEKYIPHSHKVAAFF